MPPRDQPPHAGAPRWSCVFGACRGLPLPTENNLAWGTTFVLMMTVLVINILMQIFTSPNDQRTEDYITGRCSQVCLLKRAREST